MAARKKLVRLTSIIFMVLLAFAGYWIYINLYKPNVNLEGKNYKYVFIKNNSTYDELLSALYDENIIEDHKTFEFMAKEMDLSQNIHPGRFRIQEKMNNRQIIIMLKNNKQEKVKLTLNSQIHDRDELVEYLDNKLELDADAVEDILSDETVLEKECGLDPGNVMALFLPNVYEVSWAISKDDLFNEFKTYFKSVWNKTRLEKAKKIGYSVPEVMTIASIVQSESGIETEQQKIAGVYINRLKKDMPLQADPTLKFANNNHDVQRVTNADKEIDSPYNTYKYKGLPPGPICLVKTQAIDAVLNYSKHSYIFFCAKPDFSGYSDFTSSYDAHCKNASNYQKALDKRGIHR
jgi:UPF0755 protein